MAAATDTSDAGFQNPDGFYSCLTAVYYKKEWLNQLLYTAGSEQAYVPVHLSEVADKYPERASILLAARICKGRI